MSTRSNIIIKKNDNVSVQLYNHYDSYPSGLGAELCEVFADLDKDKNKETYLSHPSSLGMWLWNKHNFEFEGSKIHLHWDIEYLYVIDLDSEEVICYSINNFDDRDDESAINGTKKDEKLVYRASMWDSYDEIDIEE